MQSGANCNTADLTGKTPLHISIGLCDDEIVEVLLSGGADVNAQDGIGNFAIHLVTSGRSSRTHNIETSRIRRASSDSSLHTGNSSISKTPLVPHQQEHPICPSARIATILLKYKASTSTKTRTTGDTPLHIAARARCTAVVELLLSTSKVEATATNVNLDTPLHAVFRQCTYRCECALEEANDDERECIISRLLLDTGLCDVNAKDKTNSTALHLAAAAGHRKSVKFLLSRGAAVDIGNNHGDTPLTIAAQRGATSIVRLLEGEACKQQ